MSSDLKRPSRIIPFVALLAGVGLIAVELRHEANIFWMIVGGAMVVLAATGLKR